MKKKYIWTLVLLITLSIFLSSFVIAIRMPAATVPSGIEERVIGPVDTKIEGCTVVHKLDDRVALKCKKDVAVQVLKKKGFEVDEVLYIMDLQADTQINADDVWELGYTGKGVTVAVLDTGIDTDHPELSDSIAGGKGFGYATYEDDHGHGTHVAGIVTANGVDVNAKGVAPDAKIWMAKVCNAQGSCYTSDIVAAIEYVVKGDDGIANNGDEPAKIISISLGGGGTSASNCDSDYLAQKVNWAVNNGVTVVAAAGNTAGRVSSPGCASKAIAVGAVDKSDVRASWSGTGLALDIMAPGVSIYSSIIGGYASWSGTSMATPHVSATIALLRQVNSASTDSQIKDALYKTAKDLGTTGWDKYYGWGRIDALAAVNYIKPPTPECTTDTECDDGLYCNGVETCNTQSGVCQTGIAIDCSGLNDQCNIGVCDEASNSCIKQTANEGLSCDDGLFCNVGETCQLGVCGRGFAKDCNDNNECTIDTCNEDIDTCEYVEIPSCTTTVKCWNADYQYLYRNNGQTKKFCKCAQGNYGYNSYSYTWSRKTVYQYIDSGNNENWEVTSRSSYLPIHQVKCTDGNWYNTNQDYFY